MTTTLAIGIAGLLGAARFVGSVAAIVTWTGAICAAILVAGAFFV